VHHLVLTLGQMVHHMGLSNTLLSDQTRFGQSNRLEMSTNDCYHKLLHITQCNYNVLYVCYVCMYVMLFVTGWRSEVNKLTQRLRQLVKEKGIAQKICEDQENELKVYRLLHTYVLHCM